MGVRAGGNPRLAIDVVAEVARLQADFDKIKKIVKDGSAQIAADTKAANDNLGRMAGGLGKLTPSAKQAAFGMRNLGFQVQDLGVQFAQAANSSDPLRGVMMALVMQGPQIKDAFNQTGKSLTGLITGFVSANPLIAGVVAVLGLATAAFALFTAETSKSAELDKYAASLGLTKEEMAKLTDVGVTAGDMFKGLWRTIDQGLGASAVFQAIKAWATDAFKTALGWAQSFAAFAWSAFAGTANAAIAMGTAAKQALTGDFAGAFDTIRNIPKGYADAFDKAKSAMSGFFAEWQRNSIVVAKERIGAQAAKLIDDRTEKKLKDQAKAAREAAAALKARTDELARAHQEAAKWANDFKFFRGDNLPIKAPSLDFELPMERERRLQDEQRQKGVDGARKIAELIGGKIGSRLDRLISALDKAFKDLFSKLQEMLGGLGKVFGEWMKGAGVGSAAAKLTGGSGLGGAIGGAIGKGVGGLLAPMLGKLGAFAGPLGAIAGGILGGVVGGLLKKVKKASQTVEIIAGDAVMGTLQGNSSKLKAAATAMGNSLIKGLLDIADQFSASLGDGIKISIGKRDKTFRVDLEGLGRTKNMPKFDTEEAAVAFAIQEVIKRGALVGLRAGTEALLKGEGDLQAQLQKAMQFENVFKELAQRANPAVSAIEAVTADFRKLVDIFDEAGATAEDYAKLQELLVIRQKEALQSAMEPIRSMLDDLKAKADSAGEAVKSAYAEVIAREADAIETYKGFLRDQQSMYAQAAQKLRDFSSSIFGDDTRSTGNLKSQFAALIASAKGGDAGAIDALPGVGADLVRSIRATASDRVSMLRELARVKAQTDAVAGAVQGKADGVQRQLAALGDIEMTIDQAAAQMQTAVAAADQARAQMALLSELKDVDLSFGDAVAAYEAAKAARDDLLRDITAAGFAGMIEVQKQTAAQLLTALTAAASAAAKAQADVAALIDANRAAQAAATVKAANDNSYANLFGRLGIPGFAAGGSFGGGVRLVGERGPEVEATGPSRIWTRDQIAGAMGGGADAVLRELIAEVAAMRIEVRANLETVSINTGQMSRDIHGSMKGNILTVRADQGQPLPVRVAS